MAILTEKKQNKTKQSLGPIIFISALFISLIGLTMLAFFFFLMYHLFTLFLSLFPSLDFKAEALLSWAFSGTNGKELAYQCRRHKKRGLDSPVFWVQKIPWRRAWQPTPVFLPGGSPWTEELGGLQSMGSQRVGHD